MSMDRRYITFIRFAFFPQKLINVIHKIFFKTIWLLPINFKFYEILLVSILTYHFFNKSSKFKYFNKYNK